jgi:hypothetical protein
MAGSTLLGDRGVQPSDFRAGCVDRRDGFVEARFGGIKGSAATAKAERRWSARRKLAENTQGPGQKYRLSPEIA